MKERLFIIISLAVIVGVLIALNAASFVRLERENDRENFPNRSTFNAGATGIRAFYELLHENGQPVMRWQESPSALLTRSGAAVKTFVVVGELRQEFTAEEAKDLLAWVKQGGKLVLIDRELNEKLLPPDGAWKISAGGGNVSMFNVPNPANVKEMTDGVTAFRPVQPTVFTKNVEAVLPSRLAGSIFIEFKGWEGMDKTTTAKPTVFPTPKPLAKPTPDSANEDEDDPPPPRANIFLQTKPVSRSTPKPQASPKVVIGQSGSGSSSSGGNPPPKAAPTPYAGIRRKPSFFDWLFGTKTASDTPSFPKNKFISSAPVVHLADGNKNILVDIPHGAGQIVILSDPYIISNGGIQLVDNAQIALNLVSSGGGTIAFDEFHQGYGASGTRIFQYFANTPFVALFWQLALLGGLLVWSQSRRFARALPLPNPDRRSKLEYVAAMAELQKRTRAYDLALETIYTRTRRNLARAVGADNTKTNRANLAQLVAERARMDKDEVRKVFLDCENIIHGDKTNARKVLELIEKLRAIETKLGLRRL